MSAPIPIDRVPPLAKWMLHGFRILIVFSEAPDIAFAELNLTPPSIEGGEPIKTTNQHNVEWHTKAARILKEFGDTKVVAMWVPETYDAVRTHCNKEQTITLLFPTDPIVKLAFFGYMQNAKPSDFNEGSTEPPTIEFNIVATMCDPADPFRTEESYVLST